MVTFFFDDKVNLSVLHQYLNDSVDIQGFWNYVPLVYCIKSPLNATELTHKLTPFFAAGFVVAEINPQNLDGRLPAGQTAWQWFYQPPTPKHTLLGGLGSLLEVYPSTKK
ncbi:hypothetical protein ABIE88_000576 [Bradyrhizobium diazoefficiens]|uniref:hypothetical protein n=1 Tax=Bradyrhizobium diazoefficiens TaxID=1355477 RepID=UPI0035170864